MRVLNGVVAMGDICKVDKPCGVATLIAPPVAKAYLANVADTLGQTLIPQLDGAARARAIDCLRIVSRLVTDTEVSDATGAILLECGEDATLNAGIEARAIECANAEGVARLEATRAAVAEATAAYDLSALEAWLRASEAGGESLRIVEGTRLAGGRSKITLRITQEGARSLPARCIVRQDWSASVTGKTVTAEHALLRHLHDHGLRVPEPLLLARASEALDNSFLLFPQLPGAPVADHFMALPSTEAPLLQLAEQLGRLHALPGADFEGMEGIGEDHHTAVQLRGNLEAYSAMIARLGGERSALLEQVVDWLSKHADRMDALPRVLVHGDLGFHNLLVDGDALVAILDWEIAHIGNPAYDLGYLRHAVRDDALWSRFIDRYRAAGGIDVPQSHIDYYSLYTGVWFHQIQLQARAALCAGAVRNIEIAALCADFAPALLASVARAFGRAAARGEWP